MSLILDENGKLDYAAVFALANKLLSDFDVLKGERAKSVDDMSLILDENGELDYAAVFALANELLSDFDVLKGERAKDDNAYCVCAYKPSEVLECIVCPIPGGRIHDAKIFDGLWMVVWAVPMSKREGD